MTPFYVVSAGNCEVLLTMSCSAQLCLASCSSDSAVCTEEKDFKTGLELIERKSGKLGVGAVAAFLLCPAFLGPW